MSEITITVDLPGRWMQFCQDETVFDTDPAIIQDRAIGLLEAVHADARAALSLGYAEGGEQ